MPSSRVKPRLCAVSLCNQKTTKDSQGKKVSYHTIPTKSPDLRKIWLKNIHRTEETLSKSAFVCSLHFLQSDFKTNVHEGIRILKTGSVPTVFPWDSSLFANEQTSVKKSARNMESDTHEDGNRKITPHDSTINTTLDVYVAEVVAIEENLSVDHTASSHNISVQSPVASNECHNMISTPLNSKGDNYLSTSTPMSVNSFPSSGPSTFKSIHSDIPINTSDEPMNICESAFPDDCSCICVMHKHLTNEKEKLTEKIRILEEKNSALEKQKSTLEEKLRNKIKTLEEKLDNECVIIAELKDEISNQKNEIETLQTLNIKMCVNNKELSETLQKQVININSIKDNDEKVTFYTGFDNYKKFLAIFNYLEPGENGENLKLWYPKRNIETTGFGRPRKLNPMDQFFMVMMRIRLGLFVEDLADRFGISSNSVSRITISWVNFVYLRLGQMSIWPTREAIDNTMPKEFKELYPTTRAILDATEFKCQTSSSLVLQSGTFSNYKSTTTYKGLLGITPSGNVSFVSSLYTGSISDKEITQRSGFLNLNFSKNDSIMADKGFLIEEMLAEKGLKLNIPPFLGKQDQFTEKEVAETQKIAALRIHVERRIQRIRCYHIFDRTIPISLSPIINELWTICAVLSNYQAPIIKYAEENMV